MLVYAILESHFCHVVQIVCQKWQETCTNARIRPYLSANYTYRIDFQRERFSETCAVIMHIGKEIRKVMEERGIKATWLAQEISTSRRNLYDILEREDINASVLAKISRTLGFNFFALYSEGLSTLAEPEVEYGKLKQENELLKEQLDLTNKLVESKDKLLKAYLKKPKVP